MSSFRRPPSLKDLCWYGGKLWSWIKVGNKNHLLLLCGPEEKVEFMVALVPTLSKVRYLCLRVDDVYRDISVTPLDGSSVRPRPERRDRGLDLSTNRLIKGCLSYFAYTGVLVPQWNCVCVQGYILRREKEIWETGPVAGLLGLVAGRFDFQEQRTGRVSRTRKVERVDRGLDGSCPILK